VADRTVIYSHLVLRRVCEKVEIGVEGEGEVSKCMPEAATADGPTNRCFMQLIAWSYKEHFLWIPLEHTQISATNRRHPMPDDRVIAVVA
jgi:hypothetical protein